MFTRPVVLNLCIFSLQNIDNYESGFVAEQFTQTACHLCSKCSIELMEGMR